MKKLLAVSLFVVSFLNTASAITVDGNVSDWGITPFVNWNTSVGTSLAHDGIKPAHAMNWGNEYAYDIEVGAIAADQNGFYVMMVLSDPNMWEDMAIAVNGSKDYRFGVDLSGLQNSQGVQQRGVYDVTQWSTSHGQWTFPDDPFQILNGTPLGNAQFVFADLGNIEVGDPNNYGATYAVEGFVAWSVLGISAPNTIGFHWAEISCLRDAIRVDTTANTNVPEPATILLLGGASAALAAARRRRA